MVQVKNRITHLEPIHGLRADFVPHQQWALRRWFYRTSLWYYHLPAPKPTLKANSTFYNLVDPELKDLCKLLHGYGIQTTPSCQGHFYKRSRFERIWRHLESDAFHIARDGLVVRDSETDRAYLFHDPVYGLPWRSFSHFHRTAAAQQSQGYLGLLIPWQDEIVISKLGDERYRSYRTFIKPDHYLSDRLNASVFSIHVGARSPSERHLAWRSVTWYLTNVLKTLRSPLPLRAGF